jgi:hypothetical protein
MKTTATDPIVAEVRAVRERHAAKFDYDLKRIFRDIQDRQKASDREFVSYPSRPPISNEGPK